MKLSIVHTVHENKAALMQMKEMSAESWMYCVSEIKICTSAGQPGTGAEIGITGPMTAKYPCDRRVLFMLRILISDCLCAYAHTCHDAYVCAVEK